MSPIITAPTGAAVTAAAIEATFTAAGQVYQGTGAGTGGLVLPPGYEIGYDQITANVTVSSTTEATGTAVISCAAHTFDGGAVLAHFFAPEIAPGTGTFIAVSLFESATQIGELANVSSGTTLANAGWSQSCFLRFTPSAGAHTYTVTAYRGSANGTIVAGLGGTATNVASFMRFTKV